MVHSPEGMIKGRLAEAIVEEMLRESGYEVYRFGYESVLQNLVQSKNKIDKDDEIGMQIKSMPDFIIVKDKLPDFIEVKYRKDGKLDPEEFKKWEEGRVILVSRKWPHFQISRIKEFKETGRLIPLSKDRFIDVSGQIIKKYEDLVLKYFSGE